MVTNPATAQKELWSQVRELAIFLNGNEIITESNVMPNIVPNPNSAIYIKAVPGELICPRVSKIKAEEPAIP